MYLRPVELYVRRFFVYIDCQSSFYISRNKDKLHNNNWTFYARTPVSIHFHCLIGHSAANSKAE